MLAVNDLWPEQCPPLRPRGRTKSFSLCSVKTPPQPSQQMPSTHVFCGESGMWGCHPELGIPIGMFVRVYLDHSPQADTSYGAALCTSGSQEGHLHRAQGVHTCVCVHEGMCICAQRHIHTGTCVYLCSQVCVSVLTGMYTQAHVCVSVLMGVCICAHRHVHTDAHVCAS